MSKSSTDPFLAVAAWLLVLVISMVVTTFQASIVWVVWNFGVVVLWNKVSHIGFFQIWIVLLCVNYLREIFKIIKEL